jgi:hypothetical protein
MNSITPDIVVQQNNIPKIYVVIIRNVALLVVFQYPTLTMHAGGGGMMALRPMGSVPR